MSSGLPLKADIARCTRHVSKVPKVRMSANLNERNVGGYSVAYRRDDTHFPVYVTAALAAVFFMAAWITGAAYWLALAVTAAGFTYYNIPLLETGRPTLGANK